jgi:anti-sigma regulatory factor (Ser/Thr protein kinase)
MSQEPQQADLRSQFYRRNRRSIPAAREFTSRALTAWNRRARADDVLLCVSELTTNALLHGAPPGRGFLLRLAHIPDGPLRIEVHDTGDPMPAPHPEAPPGSDDHGRGLFLVSTLADKWDVTDRHPGKVVWCEFHSA